MQEEINILCLDDEQNVLNSLRRLFLDDEYNIITTTSGQDALNILDREYIPLIISDYRMPGMNGIDFLKEVYKRWPDTIRIVLSGYADSGAIIEAVNEGHIYKFIPKPWHDEEFKLTIRHAIERSYLIKRNSELSSEIAQKNGELTRLNGNLTKLLDEKTELLALRERVQSAHQTVLDSIPLGLLGVDIYGMVVTCNASYLELTGDEIGLLGRNMPQLKNGVISDFASRTLSSGKMTEEVMIGHRRCRIMGNPIGGRNIGQGVIIVVAPEDEYL